MTPEAAFLGGIIVILLSSRLLGEAAQRVGQPAVIGQLVAGILLGPSFFGLLWPQLQSTLFPDEAVQKAMLDGIAQFGVLLLLLLTGMDTDLRLIQRIGRPVVTISLFGVLVPFLCGMLLGFEAPSHFVPDPDRRLITALFLGVALSISSIKIVAMVVNGMNFARRDLGQLIVTSAIAEDSIGWILIAVTFGIANSGRIDLAQFARTVGGIAIFLVVSLTLGRRVVSTAIRFVNDNFVSEFPVVTLILVVMGGMALITKGLGVQTVLGAFVAGVIIGESPILTKHIAGQLRGMVASLFAPIFFALAGLRSDLTILSAPAAAELTAALVLIASVGKFAGAFIGGAIGRLSRAESLALAIGMNARGSTEVIIATIGLSIGVLTHTLYSMIVTMAVLTTLAMPPTLRWALARLPFRPGEEKRLEQEAFEARGFVANLERFLIAADDRPDGRLASRLAGLLAGSTGQPITMLPIHSEAENGLATARSESALDLLRGADHAREGRPSEEA
jgi:Kef-type K+ transport system membrane component KefB